MKIQYASDLHLEFKENKQWLIANPIKPSGDVLVLAGDIVLFGLLDNHNDFFNYLSDYFDQTFWVPGNHEYYYYNLAGRCGTLQEKIRKNVTLVNNIAIDHNDVQFVFSTLWTHINPIYQLAIQNGMSDFKVIQYNGKPFTPVQYNEQHQSCKGFLETKLGSQTKKTIVVTHHVPTLLNYPEQYRGSVLNEAFAVELYDLIERSNASHWIYGHHHQPIPSFVIGQTTMLCNQLGYVNYQEHLNFNPSAVIEME